MTRDVAIKVSHVSKSFKLPHDKQNSIKGGLISLLKSGKRTYETQEVLKDVSFEIKKGEFFGIVGRNGSGKSTLLKLLAGIYTPNSGSIQLNGSLTPFIELGVGFNPELTGRENVYLNGALLGFNRTQMDEMYEDIVDFAELERFMDQKLKNYSSGMQVRLAFSIAIRARSDILLLDEVLAVGDAAFQQKCYDYFEMLRAEKRTVILVTHDMGAVQRFCTRAMLINRGNIVSIGPPQKIASMYNEENINTTSSGTARLSSEGSHNNPNSVVVKVKQVNDEESNMTFLAINKTGKETYIGFSIIREGATVAEINSLHDARSDEHYTLNYRLGVAHFNAGRYEVSATLFLRDTKAPVAQVRDRAVFLIKGYDDRRGGALKLQDNWD